MRRVKSIFKQLGFRPNSSVNVQKAFIANLIKQATGVAVRVPLGNAKPVPLARAAPKPVQLEFNLSEGQECAGANNNKPKDIPPAQ